MGLRSLCRAASVASIWLPLLGGSQALSQTVTQAQIDDALKQWEPLVQATIDQHQVPGLAIVIVHADKIVYLKGFGLREIGKPEPVTPDTVFQLASFSKPISATIVASVVGRGQVSWDSTIADLDPSFRLNDPYPSAEVTVRDLFAHRSGLPGGAGNELEDLGFDRAEILHRLRQVPLDGFRTTYSYSNFGLTEGAEAVAKSQGKEWADLAEQELYRPLGMKATSSRYSDFIARPDRASLHVEVDGAWKAAFQRQPDAQAPAGGVSSSVRDLAQWLRLELADGSFDGHKQIEPAALEATHVPLMQRGKNPVNGAQSFYGLGWNVEFGRHGVVWGHAGAFSLGARTLVSILPDRDLGIVILANAFPTGVPEGLADSFFDLVIDGKVQKDWIESWNAIYANLFGPAVDAARMEYGTPPKSPSPALAGSAYVGRYANDYFGGAEVREQDGKLQVVIGPSGHTTYPLSHFDRDLFLYAPSPEMPDMRGAVTFVIGADGKAKSVTIEGLDDLGLGTLKRVAD